MPVVVELQTLTLEIVPQALSIDPVTVGIETLTIEAAPSLAAVLCADTGVVQSIVVKDGLVLGIKKRMLKLRDVPDDEIPAAKLDPAVQAALGGATYSGCRLQRNASMTISDSTWTDLAWNAEDHDADGYHSTVTNTMRVTIPAGKDGKFVAELNVEWEEGDNGGTRSLRAVLNAGATVIAADDRQGFKAKQAQQMVMPERQLVAGDYVVFQCWQNSGNDEFINNVTDWSPSLVFRRVGD